MSKTLNDWLNGGRIQCAEEAEIIKSNSHLMEIFGTASYFNRRIQCADGFSLSVQASAMFSCQPNESLADVSGYTAFEIGFPSHDDPLLNARMGEDNVLGNIERAFIEQLVASHGGIVGYDDDRGFQE
jgi:hypothetical protein